jgi:hypothetical protein
MLHLYCKKDRLLKKLFDGPTKRKLFPDWSREQIFYRTFGPICRKHRRTGLIYTCQVLHISICLRNFIHERPHSLYPRFTINAYKMDTLIMKRLQGFLLIKFQIPVVQIQLEMVRLGSGKIFNLQNMHDLVVIYPATIW